MKLFEKKLDLAQARAAVKAAETDLQAAEAELASATEEISAADPADEKKLWALSTRRQALAAKCEATRGRLNMSIATAARADVAELARQKEELEAHRAEIAALEHEIRTRAAELQTFIAERSPRLEELRGKCQNLDASLRRAEGLPWAPEFASAWLAAKGRELSTAEANLSREEHEAWLKANRVA